MNHIDFSPYHNKHIKFLMDTGAEFHGAVVMSDDFNKTNNHIYRFIPTGNMIEHRNASETGDIKRMKELEQDVDITKIKSAFLLN